MNSLFVLKWSTVSYFLYEMHDLMKAALPCPKTADVILYSIHQGARSFGFMFSVQMALRVKKCSSCGKVCSTACGCRTNHFYRYFFSFFRHGFWNVFRLSCDWSPITSSSSSQGLVRPQQLLPLGHARNTSLGRRLGDVF